MGPQETFAAGAQISASRDHFPNECSTRRPGGVGASIGLVSLEELKKLATGSVETVRVKRILGRMASLTEGCICYGSTHLQREG
jgi:hypothetical protein